ncbi:MAG TPA: DMT family transporter [Candidatus Onthocola gallistercoris]|uniref:DMT family transporter n=1 Tax=Candidatus Onthocola gallistercoris TaxID=2840876 RepID=A0A9D1HGC3_9FIRM|nr:DMT family transporter [Candidatus Onthocola gallistercoris]
MKDRRVVQADLALLLVAIIWGGGFIAGKMALESFAVMEALAWRFLGAAALTGIFFHKRLLKGCRTDFMYGGILGTLAIAGQAVQMIGLNYTTPGKQAFLIMFYVVLVPFISWILLKKRPGINAFVAGVLALIGIALVSLSESLTLGLGDMLSIGFAFIFGLVIVLTGVFSAKVQDVFCMTFAQMFTAGVWALAAAFIQGSGGNYKPEAIAGVVYLAVINSFAALLIQNVAQRYTSDTHAAILLSLEAVFGVIFSVFVYHEILTPRMIVGFVVIFAAVLIARMDGKLKKTPKSVSE